MISREQRFNSSRPCPACGLGKGNDWCYVLDDGKSFWCGRADAYGGRRGRPHPNPAKGGWFHDFDPNAAPSEATSWKPKLRLAPRPIIPAQDFAAAQKKFAAAVTPAMARAFADELGLNVSSLRALGVGWAEASQLAAMHTFLRGGGPGCWTFPMRDGEGRIIGMRTRSPDGAKFSIKTSKPGLFIPADLAQGRQMVLPEGPTSAAALHVLGFYSVGRPNNNQGLDLLRGLVARFRPSHIVVLGDNDEKFNPAINRMQWPGREGAMAIAAGLRGLCSRILVAMPPASIKDARDWLKTGADEVEVQEHFEALRIKGIRDAG